MTSDSEMLPTSQTSAEFTVFPSLHELSGRGAGEQGKVFQSSDECSDNDIMRNFEEHKSREEGLSNRERVKIDTVKSSLECD